jgi:RNA polymerase sigma-54 factor
MQKSGLALQQKLQQKLSPQQILFIKMLQMNTFELSQMLKSEMEENPFLEISDAEAKSTTEDSNKDSSNDNESEADTDVTDSVDEHENIDWDEYLQNSEAENDYTTTYNPDKADWEDIPKPYQKNLIEELEEQVSLLGLTETEYLIAEQILGSLSEDGYFRRDVDAIIDNIAFNHDAYVSEEEVERIRKKIQRLDPIGIASVDLRDCLLIQLEMLPDTVKYRNLAYLMLDQEWNAFEKKHFDRLIKKLNTDAEALQKAYDIIKMLDPKPGVGVNEDEKIDYIEPDFTVRWIEYDEDDEPVSKKEKPGSIQSESGEFEIVLNRRNRPPLRISSTYKELWDDNNRTGSKAREKDETNKFIREKIEKAKWYMDAIQQRQNTLLSVMRAILQVQETFFRTGGGLRPMILKDIAEIVHMDISTISRVTKQKYVQTPFGVFELKYFFSEGMEMSSGEEVSTRQIKEALAKIVDEEDKAKPYSDDKLVHLLAELGYKVARRTVTKYREQLSIPVARMRKQLQF